MRYGVHVTSAYHHGDLRRQLLASAAQLAAETDPTTLSMRDLARRAGVSHAAPAHHFGDRRGLLSALATEGYELLAAAMQDAQAGGFEGVAVAYVRFALDHPGHYAVMYRDGLVDPTGPELTRARNRCGELLRTGVSGLAPQALGDLNEREATVAAWALVHGIVSLAQNELIDRAEAPSLALRSARQMFT